MSLFCNSFNRPIMGFGNEVYARVRCDRLSATEQSVRIVPISPLISRKNMRARGR